MTFRESASPAIVRGPAGVELRATGLARIERTTGRVERSELAIGSGSAHVTAKATVTYALDRRLGLWLPKEMREEYVTPGTERISGVARYSNYRRADVTARIVPES